MSDAKSLLRPGIHLSSGIRGRFPAGCLDLLRSLIDSGLFLGIPFRMPDRTRSRPPPLYPLSSSMNAAFPTLKETADLLQEIRTLAAPVELPTAVAAPLQFPQRLGSVADWAAFEPLLIQYAAEVIVARDWPVMLQAWEFARQGHSMELLELDRSWNPSYGDPLAEASRRVGMRQLNRMRPLRDHRVVQRYLAAVENGDARAWHPIVFGVVLAVFGIPLRQGLVHYAVQTAGGWCDSIGRSKGWPETEGQHVLERLCAALPKSLPLLPDAGAFEVK